MTRDEAVKALCSKMSLIDEEIWSGKWIEAFVALGMLKLDEPEGVREKLYRAYSGFASLTPTGLLQQLDRVGLKIVEK